MIELDSGNICWFFRREENQRARAKKPWEHPQSKARTNSKLNPHTATSQNETQATLDGGKHSHHCATCDPSKIKIILAFGTLN